MGCSSSSEAEKPHRKSADKDKDEKAVKKDKGDAKSKDKKSHKKKKSASDSDSGSDSSHSERGSPRSCSSDSDKSNKSKKSDKSNKSGGEEKKVAKKEKKVVDETWEPYVIGKLVCDKASKSWKVQNVHEDYPDVFSGAEVSGNNDWAHGHNRLCAPGDSSIKATFRPPCDRIRAKNPNAKFVVKVGYFAPWNKNPCKATILVNGEVQKSNIDVKGEHKGRTHTGTFPLNLRDEEDNEVEIKFDSGEGVLYLWYFEFKVGPYPGRDNSN